jgi:hypothetical protein
MSKWKVKEREKTSSAPSSLTIPITNKSTFSASPVDAKKENIRFQDHAPTMSTEIARTPPPRMETFPVDDPFIQPGFDLDTNNQDRTPIPLDPVALNEAKLLCREALTLITEEAARLVNHPDLAYAEFIEKTGQTKMKRPNYAYPEVLRSRLPTYIRNDASDDSYSRDAAVLKVHTFSKDNDLFCHLVGDVANPYRKYAPFVSLDFNEAQNHQNALCGLSLHAYHHHSWSTSRFSKDSENAIGAIGFRFLSDKREELKLDDCSHHCGKPRFEDPTKYPKLELVCPGPKDLKQPDVEITKIEISYLPGTGRIAGL